MYSDEKRPGWVAREPAANREAPERADMEIGKKRKRLQAIHIREAFCDEVFAKWVSEQRVEEVPQGPGVEPWSQDSLEEPTVGSACRPAVSLSITVAVAGAVVRALIFYNDIVLHPNVKHDALNTAIVASPLQSRVICFTRSVGPQASFGPLGARLGG